MHYRLGDSFFHHKDNHVLLKHVACVISFSKLDFFCLKMQVLLDNTTPPIYSSSAACLSCH